MIASSVLILYGISVISTANKTVIDLVINTFDFWFKIYNTLLTIAAAMIYTSIWSKKRV